ncbi:hypothetical protein PY310_20200 [Pseudarthrobacter sp. H3Y2-7]|uniref:hypothetical protein n=1 Tax=Pseudarthrobacter naphthalenicus TaxID=3031328 RepID=UPI0023B06E8C|nr:hypothetical protein [Pseudarthrobacter sp. H3Y2-7]MDE8670896.1 hypothetical protein [Pseudarthrobacter sp. H3Y2-7]
MKPSTQLGFAGQILSALEIRSPQDSINAVKIAVIKELEALDSSVSIHDTSYFNHTFAPDLVLSWREKAERPVYLRFTDNLDELKDGMSKIDVLNPMFFGLTSPLPGSDEAYVSLEKTAQDNHALVTDAEGIDTLIERRQSNAGVNLLSQALTRGGKGLLARPQVEEVTRAISDGFTGALETRSDATRLAVATIDQYLDEPQAARMTRVLQAVWEGSEGRLDQFPGPADFSRMLNDDSLQYILDVVGAEDPDFWRRIGRALTVTQLSNMHVTDTNAQGFQQLVNANLDVIRCRAAAVNSTNATLGSEENKFLWSVRGGTLAFEGSDFTAFIGDRKEDVDNRANGPQIGIDVEVLSRKSVGMKVSEVTLRDGGSAIQFMSDEGVGQDGRLATLAADLSASSRAEKAVVLIPDGQLSLNFKEATATAKTRSTPLMAHLLVAAMPLLHEFADERHEALEAFLHVEGAAESSGNSGTVEDLLTLLLERTSEDSE